ncbi:discoidin domain-containing protein, partial [Xanthomonas fragariae]|uniref:discoidin domain-containing protein n=1 Tax=Xanthomonas fragariae TaxID=48664 RepID=UPI001901C8B7
MAAVASVAGVAQAQERMLDGFDDIGAWRLVVSNQVSGSLRPVATTSGGHALCLDYNFNGVSGYVGIRRNLPIEYPENYRIGFALRGESPSNDLQVKLIDASGENVWWVNRPGFNFPNNWTTVSYRKRNIEKAWGPGQDKQLRSSADVEFTIYNKVGGKGTVCFDHLTLTPLAPEDTLPLKAEAITDTAPALEQRLADGKPDTFWLSGAVKQQTVTLDLGKVREFGGAVVQWVPGLQASQYTVRASSDGRGWRDLRTVTAGAGDTDWLALPDTEARYLRFDLKDGPNWRYGIKDVQLQPLAFAATPNDFIKSLAAQMPRGSYPRGFSGEQPYWTILGLDGGTEQGLIGEDGAVEVGKGGFSIEPFVVTGGKLLHWSDVSSLP